MKKKPKNTKERKCKYCNGEGWVIFRTLNCFCCDHKEEICGVCKGKGKHNRKEYF